MPVPCFADASVSDEPALVRLINAAYRGASTTVGWTDERALLAGPRIDAVTLRSNLQTGRLVTLRLTRNGPIVACLRLEAADGT